MGEWVEIFPLSGQRAWTLVGKRPRYNLDDWRGYEMFPIIPKETLRGDKTFEARTVEGVGGPIRELGPDGKRVHEGHIIGVDLLLPKEKSKSIRHREKSQKKG